MALLGTLLFGGASGCGARIPIVWKEPSSDFAPGEGLGGCPDLSGTYEVEGRGTDYLITFPFIFFVPVWWGRDRGPVRLDLDMDLVPDGSDRVKVERVARVVLAQPDSTRLVVSLLDESGSVIEGFEEIEFIRNGRTAVRSQEAGRNFHCLVSQRFSITIDTGLVISSGDQAPESGTSAMSVMMGRMPDGSLAVRTHAYMPSLFLAVDQRWHYYERATAELTP